jgi:glutamate formiminotransferase/formiminotetrahydrofolate cyclodeaminase
MRLVECVPNFSEGRDRTVLDAIAAAIERSEGAHLLDVDPGQDTNRTVVTMVAEYDRIVEAAFAAIKTASQLIDMRRHKGAHARMGATDVCPFVPVSGVTMEECVELAKKLGKRVADELAIPVYLYEHAATSDERRNLANIRAGEYEGLAEKIKDADWKPDFGKAEFNARSGATVIGARDFLVAYNVNLNTRDRRIANDIALSIREAGRNKRGPDGKFVRDKEGRPIKTPGTLKACKAVGWYIDEYNRAQVSINLVNTSVTQPADAFDEVKRQAEERGVRVTGSELVGLIPLGSMLHAARHYLKLQGKSAGLPERDLVETAVQSLGLNDISPFDPDKKIIEYRVAEKTPLADGTVRDFADESSVDSPVPGGGSVAALMGSLGCALASMVANLTAGKKGYESVDGAMKEAAENAQELKARLMNAVDQDSKAFDGVIAAMRLPRGTDEEKTLREEMIQEATKGAIDVPLAVVRDCSALMDTLEIVARDGNENSISDAGVAARAVGAAAAGALLNVLINLPGLSDTAYAEQVEKEARRLCADVEKRCDAVFASTLDRVSRAASGS